MQSCPAGISDFKPGLDDFMEVNQSWYVFEHCVLLTMSYRLAMHILSLLAVHNSAKATLHLHGR